MVICFRYYVFRFSYFDSKYLISHHLHYFLFFQQYENYHLLIFRENVLKSTKKLINFEVKLDPRTRAQNWYPFNRSFFYIIGGEIEKFKYTD